jgi:hypothetical protein
VSGESQGYGVQGISYGGYDGVQGSSTGTNGGAGVHGTCQAEEGDGVLGEVFGIGAGVHGRTTGHGDGVFGEGGYGVHGVTHGGTAVFGETSGQGGFGGVFYSDYGIPLNIGPAAGLTSPPSVSGELYWGSFCRLPNNGALFYYKNDVAGWIQLA